MRIFIPNWSELAETARNCLNIGSYCTLCARPGLPDVDICRACELQFRACLGHTDRSGATITLCPGCGLEGRSGGAVVIYNDARRKRYCNDCHSKRHPLLRDIVAPYRYAYPLDQLIKQVKYREQRQLARVLGTLLGKEAKLRAQLPLPQLLLPMPLHSARLRHRGFNQAQDIAFWAGKQVGVPLASQSVMRTVDTGSLAGLNRLERQHRILGAFRASDALAGKRVAIVDDVLTTGASARELAREIYDSGAESVDLWVLARTSSQRSGD